MKSVQLYHADCLDILPTLEAGSVDAVVTDPPYGIGACNRSDGGVGSIKSGSKFYGRQTWDLTQPDAKVIAWIMELDVPAIIWGGNHFDLPPSSCFLVWDKMQRDFSFADAELAWTNLSRAVRAFSYSRGQLAAEGKFHPTQKPLPLMKWCLSYLPNGCTVFDPFMGSGTTGVACVQTGRNFIGIEIDPAYFAIAEKRIRAAETEVQSEAAFFGTSKQPDLFASTEDSPPPAPAR